MNNFKHLCEIQNQSVTESGNNHFQETFEMHLHLLWLETNFSIYHKLKRLESLGKCCQTMDLRTYLGEPSKKKTWIFGDIVQKGGREVMLNHIYYLKRNGDSCVRREGTVNKFHIFVCMTEM